MASFGLRLSRRFGPIGGAVGAAILVAILVAGITTLRAEANLSVQTPPPLPVAALEVDYGSDARIVEAYPGLVAARRESALGFERGGRIESIEVDVGERVETGDILARLDTRALRAQLAAADAQTAEADAQVALARETEHRQEQLLARGHISDQRLAEVRTQTRAAEARRAAAAAAADALRVQLDLSVITAPFDGVITARSADEGAIAGAGQPLLNIVENGALEIRVGLPVSPAAGLNAGDAYAFEAGGRTVMARFRASTGVIERQTRTVTALFDATPEAGLSAGQVARLQLDAAVGADGFWAPVTGLAEGRRGLWSVYVLVAEDDAYRLEPRVVEALRVEADRVFVRGAVSDGDLILASGLQRVTPGQRVTPTDTAALSVE